MKYNTKQVQKLILPDNTKRSIENFLKSDLDSFCFVYSFTEENEPLMLYMKDKKYMVIIHRNKKAETKEYTTFTALKKFLETEIKKEEETKTWSY